jgi:hypothetical protein
MNSIVEKTRKNDVSNVRPTGAEQYSGDERTDDLTNRQALPLLPLRSIRLGPGTGTGQGPGVVDNRGE